MVAIGERYKIVPTGLIDNLRFRRDLLVRCAKSPSLRKAITDVCRDDPLFWMGAFAWCYEPRPRYFNGLKLQPQVPFIPWEHQVPAIREIHANLGVCDIGVEKSRGEGMSWIGVLLAMHDWLFNPLAAIGLVSKDELSADDVNNPDSLMWKCDFTLAKLPTWMGGERDKDWKRDVSKHVLRNLRNDSTITAYAATANVASGGRKKWFLKDELAKFPRPADRDAMASTQHVTECRLIVSTPKGAEGAYYDVMHEPSNMVKVVLDWKQNPTRNRGLYEWKDGKPVACDPINNPLPSNYDPPDQGIFDLMSRLRRKGFKIEGRVRSPWYDRECDRPGATPQNIAQELDRDYGGSAYRVFGDAFMEKFQEATVSPIVEGDLDFKTEQITDIRCDTMPNGPLKLWVPLDSLGNPPPGMYVVGSDISTGVGGSYTSNSSLVVIDLVTGEQAAEYAANTIVPVDFADYAIALAKWFGDAYLAWEANGPGTGFSKRVLKREYGNIYYRKSQTRRGGAGSKEAGWWTDDRTKQVLFAELQSAVVCNEVTLRSRALLRECGQYVYKEGKIDHALTKNATDDTKGASHGDRVIAAGVAIQAARDRPLMNMGEDEIPTEPPPHTMAYRMRQHEIADKRAADEVWNESIFAGVSEDWD